MSPRTAALLQALVVTFIWSASFVLIKIGLEGIPPVTFAGLRYSVAALCLVSLALRSSGTRGQIATLSGGQWRSLIALGIIYYAVSQAAQFVALQAIPSVTFSLILNFTPIAVAAIAYFTLNERPTRRQLFGIGGFLVGVMIYFTGEGIPGAQFVGILIGLGCMVSNAIGSVLGRGINRQMALSPLTVTVVSMSVGAPLMLAFGLLIEGLPSLTPTHWLIIVWLATVHTAFTFVTWNRALRHLTAVEASVATNLMIVFIAVLAWVFLDEALLPIELLGLGVAASGIFLVQIRR